MRQLTPAHDLCKVRVDGAEALPDPQRNRGGRYGTDRSETQSISGHVIVPMMGLPASIATHASAPRPRYRGGSSTPLYGVRRRPEDSQGLPPFRASEISYVLVRPSRTTERRDMTSKLANHKPIHHPSLFDFLLVEVCAMLQMVEHA